MVHDDHEYPDDHGYHADHVYHEYIEVDTCIGGHLVASRKTRSEVKRKIMKISTKQFEIAATGTHLATVIKVEAGQPITGKFGKTENVVDVTFQMNDQEGRDGSPVILRQSYTASLDRHSRFLKIVTALGIVIDYKHVGEFDTDELLGKQINIDVLHRHVADGKRFANIKAFPKTITPRQQPILITDSNDDVEESVCSQIN